MLIFCGPCVIENEESAFAAAKELKEIFTKHGIDFVFKSSYDKANRSSIHSFRGPGLEKGLEILERIKAELGLPILSDIHLPSQAEAAGKVLDYIQIPAFLCRQTDLLVAAAKTGRPVKVKKGQFMAPWDMKNVVVKLQEAGAKEIILEERGTSFGYNNLVSDMRSIPIMQSLGCPVCFDVTHSLQLPGGLGETTGGMREYLPTLAKAAVAAGSDYLYLEAHENPLKAKSDATTQISFEELDQLLPILKKLYDVIHAK
ncbi:MAG: 3-deoxy-8-phosphooctulonate synthase [Candidatus Algichlamydia australiensis]|nr:3-deoxy-8-phosphooctulonate synthase [Chlamydiales bacterium]